MATRVVARSTPPHLSRGSASGGWAPLGKAPAVGMTVLLLVRMQMLVLMRMLLVMLLLPMLLVMLLARV